MSRNGARTAERGFGARRYSGAPPHYHAHALNMLVAGKKRWLLWPPSVALYGKRPAATYLSNPPADAIQCVQKPGDALFVPAGAPPARTLLSSPFPVSPLSSGESGPFSSPSREARGDAAAAERRERPPSSPS